MTGACSWTRWSGCARFPRACEGALGTTLTALPFSACCRRERAARTADELAGLNSRLASTESVQQQMLSFLQQHLSPSLVAASSHMLPGRKRRHLLLPPSPGRDGDGGIPDGAVCADGDSLDLGIELMDGLSADLIGGPPGPPSGGLSLLELPDADPSVPPPPPPEPAHPSYHASGPAPQLPTVMPLPGAEGGGFEWSDLLREGLLPSPVPSPNAVPLTRMASEDINAILRELRVEAQEAAPMPYGLTNGGYGAA